MELALQEVIFRATNERDKDLHQPPNCVNRGQPFSRVLFVTEDSEYHKPMLFIHTNPYKLK